MNRNSMLVDPQCRLPLYKEKSSDMPLVCGLCSGWGIRRAGFGSGDAGCDGKEEKYISGQVRPVASTQQGSDMGNELQRCWVN